jgi:hypothetical protein
VLSRIEKIKHKKKYWSLLNDLTWILFIRFISQIYFSLHPYNSFNLGLKHYSLVNDHLFRCPVSFKRSPKSTWLFAKPKLAKLQLLTKNLSIYKTYIGSALFVILQLSIVIQTGYLSNFCSFDLIYYVFIN